MNRIVIGPELIKFGNFYKLYGTYFGNRSKAQPFLKSLFEQHPQDMQLISEQFKQAAGHLDQRK